MNKETKAKIAWHKKAIKIGHLIAGCNLAQSKKWHEEQIKKLEDEDTAA